MTDSGNFEVACQKKEELGLSGSVLSQCFLATLRVLLVMKHPKTKWYVTTKAWKFESCVVKLLS